MEPKKKGRPSQDKVWLSFSLDSEVAEYIKNLPDGERSKFVNNLLARGIAEVKRKATMINENMSEQDVILQQACDEMDKRGIVITAENLAEFQDDYDLEACKQWIEDNCNGA